jgi:dTDP-glucose 4,6-dehydratase
LLLSDYAGPVNIGNPNEISLKDFAEEVLKLTGSNQEIVYKPLPQDDPKQRKPDIALAKSCLDGNQKLTAHDGFEKNLRIF